MKKKVLLFFFVFSSLITFARNQWLSSTTVNGWTKPVSAGLEIFVAEVTPEGGVPSRSGGSSQLVGGKRYFDLVVSHWGYPDGDNDGNSQAENPAEWSTQDKIEKAFQYAAEGLYEATEGMHLLRNVRIFKGGKRKDNCDILWVEKLVDYPLSSNGTIKRSWGKINIGDFFEGKCLLDNVEVLGYAIVHEMGHFLFGLGDEYRYFDGDISVRFSIMGEHWKIQTGDYRGLNFSTRWRGGTPGYFGDWENTMKTDQYRLHKMCCWRTLAYKPKNRLDARPFYLELRDVAPSWWGGQPTIQLPAEREIALSALNIIWEVGTVIILAVDRSGSMAGDTLAKAKESAKAILDLLEDGTDVGVIAFDHEVTTVQAVTTIHTNDMSVPNIKAAIDGITDGGNTAIGDAARVALNTLLDIGISNRAAVVYLLTDGESNAGEDPANVIPDYQQAQVALVGFGYGNAADYRMEGMARETGGIWFGGLESLADMRAAFGEAAGMVADLAAVLNGSTGVGNTPVHLPFAVDPSVTKLWVSASWAGGPADASLTLTAPDGVTAFAPSSVTQVGGEVSVAFAVDSPGAGEWALDGTRAASVSIAYFANAAVAGEGFSLKIEAAEYDKETGEVLAVASLMGEASVDGAAVTGTLDLRDGTVQSQTFTNAAPGIYMALFPGAPTPFNETWRLTVRAGNPDGGAVFTWKGAQIGMLEDGTVPEIEDIPVTNGFSRVATASVTYPFPILTVKNGTGGGRYTEGATAAITAVNPHPDLMVFNGWTGETQAVADVSAPATTVIVSNSTAVAASWLPVPCGDDYLILDLPSGTSSYTNAPPPGGWDGTHKTDQLVMRKVSPGTFVMGDGAYPNAPPHSVTLTEIYYLGVFEVTQRQWNHVNGDWPGGYTGAGRDTHPVESVSWDAIRGAPSNWPNVRTVEPGSFMGKLRARMGGGRAFDLPTEAQWEHACRAGTTAAFFPGDSISALGDYAWVAGNATGTQPVGLKPANPWGFHDIAGNVNEMCLDWYAETLGLAPTNPPGAIGSASGWRMRRGWSYATTSPYETCRSGYRYNYLTPPATFPNTGLRLAWTAGEGAALAVSGGLVNTGGVYLAGTRVAVAPVDPGDGSAFLRWETDPPGAGLGPDFRAGDPCTVVTVPAGGVTLTPVWGMPPDIPGEPDVVYEPAPILTQTIAVWGGGAVTLTWAPPGTPHTVTGYILEGKADLADGFWERPEGEALLPPEPRAYTLPPGGPLRFFRVTAVTERPGE